MRVAYNVEWRKDSGNWIRLPRTGNLGVEVEGIYSGRYVARVSSINAMDVTSIWGSSTEVVLTGKTGLPPAVSFLTTTSELFGIGIKWGFPPGAEDTQRTEIWYGPANDLGAATKLADLAYPQADYRMQQLLAGATLFFWARLVDRTGNIGPFYPVVGGVMGQASSEASPILNLLAGKISKSELGQDLLSDIEKIPGLQDQIDALDDILLYDAARTYAAGDTVRQGQRLYQATGAVPINTPPPNAAYWLDVGQTVGTVGALAQQVALNKASIETVDGKVTAQASAMNVLRAATRDDSGNGDKIDALKGYASTAAIATQAKVIASNEEASAQRTTTLDAKVNQNAANVTLLENTVATNKQAFAQQVAQVSAEIRYARLGTLLSFFETSALENRAVGWRTDWLPWLSCPGRVMVKPMFATTMATHQTIDQTTYAGTLIAVIRWTCGCTAPCRTVKRA